MSDAFDLRKLAPGLPKQVTRDYLDGLSPEQSAALLTSLDRSVRAAEAESVRTETEAAQLTREAERVEAEIKAKFGVSTVEELDLQIEEATAKSLAAWDKGAAVM